MNELLAHCRALSPKDLFGHHIVPAGWTPPTNEIPFPYPKTYVWQSLSNLCAHYSITRTIVCAVPFMWQLEPLVYPVARDYGAPVAVVSPKNLPLIRPYAEQAGVDMIITTPEALQDISNILACTTAAPKVIVVIHHDAETLQTHTASTTHTQYVCIHELHLVPGLPLFSQIPPSNSAESRPTLQRNEVFTWSTETNTISFPDAWGAWPKIAVPMPGNKSSEGFTLYA